MYNITVAELKKQLNIELPYTDDDVYLADSIAVAELSVNNYLGASAVSGFTTVTGYTSGFTSNLPVAIRRAILIVASHLYLNRSLVNFGNASVTPFTFNFLLDNYQNIVIK
jgi:hypothetical protein